MKNAEYNQRLRRLTRFFSVPLCVFSVQLCVPLFLKEKL